MGKIEKSIDLSGLPKKIRAGKEIINWIDSVGHKVPFVYKDIEGMIEIVGYSDEKLLIKYLENKTSLIGISEFKMASIGGVIGCVTNDFRYEVGEAVKDDKRDLIITDREYRAKHQRPDKKGRIYVKNYKYYKYACNICSWTEGWVEEHDLKNGQQCACCCKFKKTIVAEINSMWKTDYWMVELGVNEEWAKANSSQCNKQALCKCPHCGREIKKNASKIYRDKSIGCTCGDGFSYPEKLMGNVLMQLGVEFETEYSPDYLVREENGKKSRKYSDFYLPKYNLIIETDGGLCHEEGKIHSKSDKSIEEYVAVDNWKDKQHRIHSIDTIRINCFKSDMEYIKNNILNSELPCIFDFDMIDWNMSDLYAIKSNRVKEICDYWNNRDEQDTVLSIAKTINESHITITNYLKKGTKLGWCNYDPKEEMRRCGKRNSSLLSMPIEVFRSGESIGKFMSASHLGRVSDEILGVKISQNSVSNKLNPKRSDYNKPYKKIYTFKYISEEEYEKYKNSQKLSNVV